MEEKELMGVLDSYFTKERKFIDTSRIPLICQDIHNIHQRLVEMDKKLDEKVVTQDQFWPVKTLVYGAVGLMLAAILTALIYLVIK